MISQLLTTLTVVTVIGMGTASATVLRADHGWSGACNVYDNTHQTYTTKFNDGWSNGGFWLVASPGDYPKVRAQDYAVLYDDRASNRIVAHAYDDVNSAGGFRIRDHLSAFDDAFSESGNDGLFEISIPVIDNIDVVGDWEEVPWDGQQSNWFEQSDKPELVYTVDVLVEEYALGGEDWVDTVPPRAGSVNCGSNPLCQAVDEAPVAAAQGGLVSAPGGLALVLMGFAGIGLRRRR